MARLTGEARIAKLEAEIEAGARIEAKIESGGTLLTMDEQWALAVATDARKKLEASKRKAMKQQAMKQQASEPPKAAPSKPTFVAKSTVTPAAALVTKSASSQADEIKRLKAEIARLTEENARLKAARRQSGRKPLGERAMTAAERMRKMRDKRKAVVKAARRTEPQHAPPKVKSLDLDSRGGNTGFPWGGWLHVVENGETRWIRFYYSKRRDELKLLPMIPHAKGIHMALDDPRPISEACVSAIRTAIAEWFAKRAEDRVSLQKAKAAR